jgi:hypothetical protein
MILKQKIKLAILISGNIIFYIIVFPIVQKLIYFLDLDNINENALFKIYLFMIVSICYLMFITGSEKLFRFIKKQLNRRKE